MAVPKKRTGHSAQGKRRSNWKATKPALTKCPNCGQAVLAHTVCTACGTYKGKPVSLKDRVEEVQEVKEEKKTKKSTKKAKTEEVKEEVVEEVKAEVEEAKAETSEEKAE
jgi:large subunit ribosomal protein L32